MGHSPLCSICSSAFSYRGVFSAEFKLHNGDGVFKLVEINARPWWYVQFASQCAMEVCTMAYRDALGLPIAPVEDYEVDRRLHPPPEMIYAVEGRHYDYIPSLGPLLRSWIHSNSTPFHRNDPAPALAIFSGR
jgi:D-aspartate ligase